MSASLVLTKVYAFSVECDLKGNINEEREVVYLELRAEENL